MTVRPGKASLLFDVELLLELGYTTDEIEEMLLDSDLFEQTMNEVKALYQR